MNGGFHGPWCGSRTWRTKCPTCREPVFFFSCSCGSKVYFDQLGQPWPVHRCQTARARPAKSDCVREEPEFEFASDPCDPGLRRWRERIDEQVAVRARAREARRTRDPIVAVAPRRGAPRELIGVLRELCEEADPFRAFDLPDTSMSRALSGELGRGRVARITMHVPAPDDDEFESYTIWIPRSADLFRRLEAGMTVAATVVMREVGKDHVWWSTDLEAVVSSGAARESEDE